jgi:ankyrin repeat protein
MKSNDINQELSNAVITNDISKIKKCISLGANVNIKDVLGNGLLRFSPTIETVKILVQNGIDIYTLDRDGANGLYGADIEVLKFLVENKRLSIHIKDKKGQTPLHVAKNLDTVIYLIKNGLDVNQKDIHDRTILINAMNRKQKSIVDYLLKNKSRL